MFSDGRAECVGHSFDHRRWQSARRCISHSRHHISPGQPTALGSQVLESGNQEVTIHRCVRWSITDPTDQADQIGRINAEVGGPGLPCGAQAVDGLALVLVWSVDMKSRAPQPSRGTSPTTPMHELINRCSPLGEQTQEHRVDSGHVPSDRWDASTGDDGGGPGRGDRFPGDTGPTGQFVTEGGVIHRPDGTAMEEQSAGVGRRPRAVYPLGHVGHHQVRVQMRIEGAAGAVDESGRYDSSGGHPVCHPCLSAPHPVGHPLDIAHGIGHGGLVGGTCGIGQLPRGEQVQNADRLGRTEHQIDPGHRSISPRCTQRAIVDRVMTGEHLVEHHRVNFTPLIEHTAAAPDPHPRGLPRHPSLLGPTGR